ncbi:phage baseplate assembly protein V [Enterobacter roggenkampii]|uniref:Baseplate assembly protein V n=1 Tax=Myoviridae sp. ctT3B27 TaxID=2826655 RepID=A0A8S5NA76_9CAUD|nr:phage baseplate assembly protein V [Enterobacter roggenkampii]MBK4124469.1 phage baseplate assembly protein V [Enterobacter roggenkampii]MBW4236811.1 phage baseplate assembly protein V [Enterobacter roggenkampii]DAD91598.1 MAG TPA: baseplate assembly protein V [Myoviridae sp. ctT3B27]
MSAKNDINELLRLLLNIVRTGTITEVDTQNWLCRVQTGELETNWIPWLTTRAGDSVTWWAPSVDEQVLLLAVGGDLSAAFVLPGIYSNDKPPPSTDGKALVTVFPDAARFEYSPETGTLHVSGVKNTIFDSESIELNTNKFTVNAGKTEIKGAVEQSGGSMSSNGVVVDDHDHGGIQKGSDWTKGIQ